MSSRHMKYGDDTGHLFLARYVETDIVTELKYYLIIFTSKITKIEILRSI